MIAINPYLNFPGNTEEAFNFYKNIFGGEFMMVQRFKDTPEGGRTPDHEKDKLMHISLPVGKNNILMATDVLESMGHKLVEGNNFNLHAAAESKEEADKIFNGLSEGGKVTLKIGDTFWGDYFGMVTDKFGINWMVGYTKPKE